MLGVAPVKAATITSGDLIFTANTSGTGVGVDLNGSANIDDRDLENSKGDRGQVTASATNLSLITHLPNPGDFSISGGNLKISAYRDQSAGSGTSAASMASYTIDFSVEAGEMGSLGLSFDYLHEFELGSSSLDWGLSDTGGAISGFGGTLIAGTSGTLIDSIASLVSGDYTLVIEVSSDFTYNSTSGNSSNPNEIDLSNFVVTYTSAVAVPEPSTMMMLSIFSCFLLGRKSRWQA